MEILEESAVASHKVLLSASFPWISINLGLQILKLSFWDLILLDLHWLLLNEVNLILDVKYCLDLQACWSEAMYHVTIYDWHLVIGDCFFFILFLDLFKRYSDVNLSISVAELQL